MGQDIRKKEEAEEFRFGKNIQRVGNLFRRLADDNLSHLGINISQLRILGYLSRFGEDGEVCQRDLEEAFGVRRSSVTSILNNMEKSGYLVRRVSSEDARVKKVSLTEKGKALDESLRSYIYSLEGRLLDGITPEESEVMKRCLVKMLENLEETERNPL
jgi:DNA-binding MarR family transcriptional regulator